MKGLTQPNGWTKQFTHQPPSSALLNIPPGDYTVVATHLTSTCASIFYTGTVDGPDPLKLTFTPTVHGSTNNGNPCINPDGSLTVNIVAGGSGNYAYQWYKGEGTSTPIPNATTSSLNGVRADRYTVEVTDFKH